MANMPLKSILKKSSAFEAGADSTVVQVLSKEERARESAIFQAQLLEERKKLEMEIVLAMERLIDLPLDPTSTAARPASSDASLFKELLQLFQPNDYDDLIVERNINDHCGYTLCPKPRVRDKKAGTYKLIGLHGPASNFKIVKKEEVEKWCSEDCARRAMYIRVQLDERPAWERQYLAKQVKLFEEGKSESVKLEEQLPDDLKKLDLNKDDKRSRSAAQLAAERGDKGAFAEKGRVKVAIREKENTGPAAPPSNTELDTDSVMSGMRMPIEGYTPKFNHQR
jgi:hypothetical protein